MDTEALEALTQRVNESADRAEAALDRLERQQIDLAATEADARQRAIEEFADVDPKRLAALLG